MPPTDTRPDLSPDVAAPAEAVPRLTGTFQQAIGRPFLVAAASLSVSLAFALIGVAVEQGSTGMSDAASKAPWWSWLAGLAGFAILVARPVAAAVVGALVLDQIVWLGFAQQSVGVARIAGAALMVAGAALVCGF